MTAAHLTHSTDVAGTFSSDGLPNLVVAGVPRSGTSALYAYLAAHPQVAGSSVKEVQYFVDEGSALFHRESNFLAHGLAGYRRYFVEGLSERPSASVVFEATPGYIYQRAALDAMPTLPTSPRFLFQLRRPSAQVYSSYLYSLNQAGNLDPDVTFREFAFGSKRMSASSNEFHRNALAFVDYESFLSMWHGACGTARIRVSCFEALRQDPHAYLRDLAIWLGIDPQFYETYDFEVVNKNVVIRSRTAQTLVRRASPLLVGRARKLGLRLYRFANTRSIAGPSDDDRSVMREIDDRMRGANERLTDRFNVDLRVWEYA